MLIDAIALPEQVEESGQASPRMRATLSLFAIVFLAGFAGSLALQLLNMAMQRRGLGSAAIGASTSIQALGIVAGAILSMRSLDLFGSARTIVFGSAFGAAALAVAAACEDSWALTVARFCCGFSLGMVVTHVEYIVLARAPLHRRATTVAIYATVYATGTALGPATLGLLGPEAPATQFLGPAGLLMAAMLVHPAEIRRRVDAPLGRAFHLDILRAAPLAFTAALLLACSTTGSCRSSPYSQCRMGTRQWMRPRSPSQVSSGSYCSRYRPAISPTA